jgi:hypothetical protein
MSRWKQSEVSYGPVGRVVATVLVVFPVLFAVFYSAVFLIAGALWGLFILPMALRHIWRPVRDDSAPSELLLPSNIRVIAASELIDERVGPARW